MKAVWSKSLYGEMNVTLGFYLDLKERKEAEIFILAENKYKVIADSRMTYFGPEKSNNDESKISHLSLNLRRIVIEVSSLNIETYNYVRKNPYFSCYIRTEDGKVYTNDDFKCFLLSDRIKKTPRISLYNEFEEVYKIDRDRYKFYEGSFIYDEITDLTECEILKPVISVSDNPKLSVVTPELIKKGYADVDMEELEYSSSSYLETGNSVSGYKKEEVEFNSTSETSTLKYSDIDGYYEYKTYDLKKPYNAFIHLDISIKSRGMAFVVFDTKLNEKGFVDYSMSDSSKSVKWMIVKPGIYNLDTFNPYTFRYLTIIYTASSEIHLSVTDYMNPLSDKLRFDSLDDDIDLLMNASLNVASLSSLNLNSDHEDSLKSSLFDNYFQSLAYEIFTGSTKLYREFLREYVSLDREKTENEGVPKYMPMDLYLNPYDASYSLFYLLSLSSYLKNHRDKELMNTSKNTVYALMDYFKKHENEYYMLESITGSLFHEKEYKGIDISFNMAYSKALEETASLYKDKELIKKAVLLKKNINSLARMNESYACGLAKTEDGSYELDKEDTFTDFCALYFDIIPVKERSSFLSKIKMDELKEKDAFSLILKYDYLKAKDDKDALLKEIKKDFLKNAEKHHSVVLGDDYTSSIMTIISYYLIYASTGYDFINKTLNKKNMIEGLNTKIQLPDGRTIVSNNGKTKIK